jgi:hypothetical protein
MTVCYVALTRAGQAKVCTYGVGWDGRNPLAAVFQWLGPDGWEPIHHERKE